MPESTERGALTETVFYILLSLHKPMHGYGIMQFIRDLSKERVRVGPGTLYGALRTLLEKGWIRALYSAADSRRKEYEITAAGRRIVGDEMLRLRELIGNADRIVGGTECADTK
jgi:DNA-binding PadR family transcriptional regulator